MEFPMYRCPTKNYEFFGSEYLRQMDARHCLIQRISFQSYLRHAHMLNCQPCVNALKERLEFLEKEVPSPYRDRITKLKGELTVA